MQNSVIQKEQRGQRLILRRSRDLLRDGEMREERTGERRNTTDGRRLSVAGCAQGDTDDWRANVRARNATMPATSAITRQETGGRPRTETRQAPLLAWAPARDR